VRLGPPGWAGLAMLGVIALAAILGPVLSPYGVHEQDLAARNSGPSWAHPFGTAALGEDVFTQVLAAGRVSLVIGLATALVATAIGAGLGLLSGLTGTGGGIFLTPLGIFLRWDKTKTIAAVSAAFILVNSISGLSGHIQKTGGLPGVVPILAVAALAGGAAGSYLGSARLPHTAIKRLLAVVLLIAGIKLIFA
jgi:ABC-type dipeptide/oligopeptide/nickel transport system permease subunit